MTDADLGDSPFGLLPGWSEWQAGRRSDRDMAALAAERLGLMEPLRDEALERRRLALAADFSAWASDPKDGGVTALIDRLLDLIDDAFA